MGLHGLLQGQLYLFALMETDIDWTCSKNEGGGNNTWNISVTKKWPLGKPRMRCEINI
jgi:hypothetical protein